MPINFNQPPYYDDFKRDDFLYRLLFQPGRAVQAKELTQIQSLLQSQIATLGEHIFKDGSLVTGGGLVYDKTDIKWLALKGLDFKDEPIKIRSITPGLYVRKSPESESPSWNPRVYGKIVEVRPSENDEPDTIYFQWEGGEPNEAAGETGFGASEHLLIYDRERQLAKYSVTTLDPVADGSDNPTAIHYGTASRITVRPGIYFWKGLFIRSLGGTLVLGKYNTNTSYRIGFSVQENINTSSVKALDPASGASNHGAPGADRYEIKLSLHKIGDGITVNETILENFIEVARVVNGELITSPQDQTLYNILGERLAQRTYEESGNYLASPYKITVKNKSNQEAPKLVAKMSDGVAYVRGHRRTLNRQTTLDIDKGRDVLMDSFEVTQSYGDNHFLIYDRADNSLTNHKEKANGVFAVGSGAGIHTSNAWYGEKGAAVSVHCVPHDQVKDYSLTDQWKWNSTLVGTARPIQMAYGHGASHASDVAGRPGTVYRLWMDDFNSSPITNAVSVSNILNNVSAYGNTLFGVFHLDAVTTHGITSNDEISVTGQSPWDGVTSSNVAHSNSIAILVSGDYSSYAASDANALTLRRTTGETTGLNSVVLDEYTSAAWNDSYVGATIRINNGTDWSNSREIVGFIGTDGAAEALWDAKKDPESKWALGTGPAPGRRATVLLDGDLNIAPVSGYTYELTMNAKQARSIVYNYNKSTTGAEQYPAKLTQMWNIDPISGVVGGNTEKLSDDFYGGRIDGAALFNNNQRKNDALLYDTGKRATKSVLTHGELDTGMTSNTILYYTEYVVAEGAGATTLDFLLPAAANYDFFDGQPVVYPYTEGVETEITDVFEIKANYILINKTKGTVHTADITKVQAPSGGTAGKTKITKAVAFVAGDEYLLNLPVRAKYAKPAYKKLITANTTKTITAPAGSADLTDFSRGQILIANAEYGTAEGSRISLKKPDIFKITKVVANVHNDQANTDLSDTTKDWSSHFSMDTGQRDTFYDNGGIELTGDAPTGNLLVCFDYFQRMDKPKSDDSRVENLTEPSYFAIDSYQYTTDLTFDEVTDAADTFAVGQKVTGNSGAIGHVVDYANTTGGGAYAKVRLEGVTGTFEVGNWVRSGTSAGKVRSVTTSDLKYSDIPKYKNPSGDVYLLRNMIDMRPYVSSNNLVSDKLSNAIMPLVPSNKYRGDLLRTGPGMPTKSLSDAATASGSRYRMSGDVKVSNYAGRIDKVIVTDKGTYTTIRGVSSQTPVPPREDPDGKMFTIATVTVPPYTMNPEEVQVVPNMSVRHTMKDISRLARRVENLEYYVSLNALEKSAIDQFIVDGSGNPRFKNGIIVDNFSGPGVKHRTSKCATGSGVLRPSQQVYDGGSRGAFNLDYIGAGGDTIRVSSGGYSAGEPSHSTIQYDTEELIRQGAATGLESVNPYDVQDFTGNMTLTPDTDHWIDMTMVPEYGAVLAGSRDNPLAELSSPEYSGLTAEEIVAKLEDIDGLWDIISGISVGDNITGTSYEYTGTPDDGFELTEVDRNINLGDVSAQRYTALADIDAAIARAAGTDGMFRSVDILPYARSRDITIKASGLKPTSHITPFFDGTWLGAFYGSASEIYINSYAGEFQPDIDGTPERIELTGLGGKTANALLVAIREPEFLNQTVTDNGIKIGYIVPEFTDIEKGRVDYNTYKDGYYASSWSADNITKYGFFGTGASGARTITGRRTTQTATLVDQAGASVKHLYNGHYVGTARNAEGVANTSHLVLSPDAHRYIANNFGGSYVTNSLEDVLPRRTFITIIAGYGHGALLVANTYLPAADTIDGIAHPVIELRTASDGTNPLTADGRYIDHTSVYCIWQGKLDTRRNGVHQIGKGGLETNRYGDFIGTLHMPPGAARREDGRGNIHGWADWTAGANLVELRDRGFNASHLVQNYASAVYTSGGEKHNYIDDQTLSTLQAIRSKLSAFQIETEGDTIEASDASGEGILGVVTAVNIANGMYTAHKTHSVPFVPGPGQVGDIVRVGENEFSAWADHLQALYDMNIIWDEATRAFISYGN
jgi:hypothetical protein